MKPLKTLALIVIALSMTGCSLQEAVSLIPTNAQIVTNGVNYFGVMEYCGKYWGMYFVEQNFISGGAVTQLQAASAIEVLVTKEGWQPITWSALSAEMQTAIISRLNIMPIFMFNMSLDNILPKPIEVKS